jgi:PAS domain S-box-containing protein
MHSLLARQIKRYFGETFHVLPEWEKFIAAVDDAYREFDTDREMLERSLDLSSGELLLANAEMRAFFRAIPDILFRIDNDGVILDYKAGSTVDFLMNPKEMLGRHIQDVPIKGVGGQFRDAISRIRDEKKIVSIEYSLVLQEVERFYEARFVPLDDHDIMVIVRDITTRRLAESAMLESEERYRILVEESPDAIVVHSRGKVLYGNSSSLKLMRATPSDNVLGRDILDFVHPDSRARVMARISEMSRASKPFELLDEKFLRLDGTTINVEVVSAPVTFLGKPCSQVVLRDITERKQIEEQLRLQSAAINNAPSGIVVTDNGWTIVWGNPAFERLTGYSSSEIVGKNLWELVEQDSLGKGILEELLEIVRSGKSWHGELLCRRRDDTVYTEDMTIAPVFNDGGSLSHIVAIKQDITDRRSLEERFLQAQKLEGIGRLAGGVAHDYNNILGVIVGHATMLKKWLNQGDPARLSAEAILAAANRGTELTKQLLAFARKEIVSPKVINVNSSIDVIEKMLQRIIGENLTLEFLPEKNLWNIKIDPTQFDQILVNLATNARDAINDIGAISIKTSNVKVDQTFARGQAEIPPGEYVLITFADTGQGMDKETLEHIFEPFFTTKSKEQGTGLGLSTVYGIVKQNNGSIQVESQPGKGTEFRIYLPRFCGEIVAEEKVIPDEELRGDGTVLIVEDQADLLDLTRISLEEYGYKVLTALGPGDALLLCETYPGEINLLLTDVIMPVMNGKELSKRIKVVKPGIKTLFMSGHTADMLTPHGILDNNIELLEKPFAPQDLAKKVHDVLNK